MRPIFLLTAIVLFVAVTFTGGFLFFNKESRVSFLNGVAGLSNSVEAIFSDNNSMLSSVFASDEDVTRYVYEKPDSFEDPLVRVLGDSLGGGERIESASATKFLSSDELPLDDRIEINLDEMRLYVFENGIRKNEYEVLSIGKQGTPWETPAGTYSIRTKEEKHFSSIGKVWMPYSMQFFGNFFIHGWPYYENGREVAPGYSGGCIRLSTEDAKKVYELINIGTPVRIVRSGDDGTKEVVLSYERSSRTKPPRLSAKSYVVADVETGDVILGRDYDNKMPIASVSKLMTALISLEVLNQYQDVKIDRDIIETEGNFGGLSVGEMTTTGELLYPLLIESSNDAAEALAHHLSRSYFISQMNEKSKAIGLRETSFDDPSGLSPRNVSTARDLFRLLQYIDRSKQYVFDVTKLVRKESTQSSISHTWINNNPLVKAGVSGYVGGKHGFTDQAGKTLAVVVKIRFGEFDERKIAIVLLKSEDLSSDFKKVESYLINNISYKAETVSVTPVDSLALSL